MDEKLRRVLSHVNSASDLEALTHAKIEQIDMALEQIRFMAHVLAGGSDRSGCSLGTVQEGALPSAGSRVTAADQR